MCTQLQKQIVNGPQKNSSVYTDSNCHEKTKAVNCDTKEINTITIKLITATNRCTDQIDSFINYINNTVRYTAFINAWDRVINFDTVKSLNQ